MLSQKSSNKQKTAREEPYVPFESIPFAAMMQKMMGRQGQGCDCVTQSVMSQMMAMRGGAQDEAEEEIGAEVNQKA